ncbi:hypothetical protein K443DRAFT_109829, partial [Laccaria amethystina LaAM-08-1]
MVWYLQHTIHPKGHSIPTSRHQYFIMPHTFLQEWSHSTGIRRNSTGIHRNGTGIHRNGTGIHRNGTGI